MQVSDTQTVPFRTKEVKKKPLKNNSDLKCNTGEMLSVTKFDGLSSQQQRAIFLESELKNFFTS